MNRIRSVAICTSIIASQFLTNSIVLADVIYVDDSAINGANDGTSWVNAFIDLQDALAIAQTGDEIRVGQGVYTPAPPNGDRTISFNLVSGTILQGGYAGFGASDPDALDPVKFQTILSGDLNGNDGPNFTNISDNAYHVVRTSAAAPGTAIRGVTVTAGNANNSSWPHNSGGGLRNENGGDLLIIDCVVRGNRARGAPGVQNIQSSITLRRTRVAFNTCVYLATEGHGGGLSTTGRTRIDNCWFEGNSAGIGSGGAVFVGGTTDAIFHSTTFLGNGAEYGGAASGSATYIDCKFLSNGTLFDGIVHGGRLINCVFADNWASQSVGGAHNPEYAINCLFIGNRAASVGAVLASSSALLLNCSIVGNRAIDNANFDNFGGIALYQPWMGAPSSPRILNCLVWGNTTVQSMSTQDQQIRTAGSVNIEIQNSCIQGWTGSLGAGGGGGGNHGSDPRFVDADGPDDIYGTADDDVRLLPNSLCIDSADRALLPPDTFDIDDDGDTTEPLPIDLDGLPRVVGSSLDAGAYEFQGMPCRADIDGNATVNVNDLLAVILEWGPCVPAAMCNSDLDLNRTVGLSDLLAVINTWGACP